MNSMNSVFPIQQRQGIAFQTLNDFLKLLENVQSGRYIITQGHGWHSGIHLTSKEAPWGQGFRPIQAMLGGKLVAYRFNQQYLESDFQTLTDSVTLKYSNNFVLLEHEYLNSEATDTTPQEEKSFKFYTLYMHLAPSSDIGANSAVQTHYQFTQSLNAHFFQHGSEPSEATKDGDPQLLPSSTVIEYLDADSEKTSLYQGYHYIKCRVARVPSDSEHLKGKIVWIASGKDSKFDRLQNDAFFVPAPLPKWMSSQDLKTDGTVVVNPKSNEEDVMVMTGEAIGYMGLHQASRDLNGTVEQDFRVHIECFSPTKPPEFFLKSISPDKQSTHFHYIDGSNDGSVSSGEVSPENDFFVEIAQYVAQQSGEVFDINSYQRVGQLRAYLNNKRQYLERIVVKHKSEWHSENTTTMGEKIYLYALKVLEDKLSQTHLPDSYENSKWRNEIFLPSFGRFKDHEMERMAKFSWLDECSELSLGSELWYFWPLAISRGSQNSISIRYVRKWQTSKSTIGEFYIEGSSIKGFFLEPAGPDTTIRDLDKRIPIGEYSLCWHYGGHYKGVLKLYNEIVPKDRNILIHNGNFPEDTEGCLLCGVKRGKDYVGPSVVKLEEIKSHFNKVGLKNAKIIITEDYQND